MQVSGLVRPLLAAALGLAWILAGVLVADVAGLTDEPGAPTWAVLIAAWLPMTLALVAA